MHEMNQRHTVFLMKAGTTMSHASVIPLKIVRVTNATTIVIALETALEDSSGICSITKKKQNDIVRLVGKAASCLFTQNHLPRQKEHAIFSMTPELSISMRTPVRIE